MIIPEIENGLCLLCKRQLGKERISRHHLVQKTKKGKVTETIHNICHQKIHSVFTEKELADEYNTVNKTEFELILNQLMVR
jgi:5-methylcytosine-specific restriction endonuclease McrA